MCVSTAEMPVFLQVPTVTEQEAVNRSHFVVWCWQLQTGDSLDAESVISGIYFVLIFFTASSKQKRCLQFCAQRKAWAETSSSANLLTNTNISSGCFNFLYQWR